MGETTDNRYQGIVSGGDFRIQDLESREFSGTGLVVSTSQKKLQRLLCLFLRVGLFTHVALVQVNTRHGKALGLPMSVCFASCRVSLLSLYPCSPKGLDSLTFTVYDWGITGGGNEQPCTSLA